jgi:autotransporter-associated beta strand protein
MKAIIYLFFLSQLVFSQVTTVQYTQQTSEYDLSLNTSGTGGIFNSGSTAVGMWMNGDNSANGYAGHALWKTFRIGSSISNSSRPLQIGDEFTITINTKGFYYGTIGVSLNSGNLPAASWANRTANSRIRIQQDGANFGPSSPGSWYYSGNTSGSFSLTPTGSYVNYVIKVKLISQSHCNVSINGNWIYDVPLAGNINDQITNFSIYMSDDRAGVWSVNGGNRGDTYWKEDTQLQNTGSINIGASNNSYTISTPLQNGLDANSLSSNGYSNGLTKEGTGTIILTAANNYSGLTTINNGTLQLNRTGGGTIPNTNHITVNSGATLRISSNQTLADLTISSGGLTIDDGVTLTISGTLTYSGGTINYGATPTGKLIIASSGKMIVSSGTFTTSGNLTLKSDANGTAQVAAIGSGGSITGNVTVERYIPAGKRAFRLLSPAVTTSNYISNNWQQQTHITGGLGTTGLGFDDTATDNPSMFTFDNQATSGSGWASIPNTNDTNLIAGTGYRVLIRGNTSVNLTAPSADAMNAAVTLSATGMLRTGSITLDSSSSPSINNTNYNAGFSLVGNPYQSPIDWNAVTKTNIEPTYYAWDPNMGTTSQRGRYVTFNGTVNSVVDGDGRSSNVGQFIQPGQAFFVKYSGSGAGSLTFDEADKVATYANVFRTANLSTLTVSLYDPNELAIAGYPIDAMKAIFNTDYSNDMGLGDAIKLEASGENMAWYRNATKLAIDAAAPLTSTDELAMKTIRLGANKNYTLKINTTNFDATLTPYLVDNFLNTQTEISTTQAHLATFNTTDVAASFGEDRFKIVFQPSALNADDFTHGLVLYPNPAKAGDSFYVQGSTAAEVTVYNVLGQHIPVQVKSQGNALQVTPTHSLSQGIYLVTVRTEGKTQHVKWIVE